MLPEEIKNIDVDSLTEEEARERCLQIINDEIKDAKSATARMGIISVITLIVCFFSESKGAKFMEYASMGLYAFFGNYTFKGFSNLHEFKKIRKQITRNTIEKTYKELLAYMKDFYAKEKNSTIKNSPDAPDQQD